MAIRSSCRAYPRKACRDPLAEKWWRMNITGCTIKILVSPAFRGKKLISLSAGNVIATIVARPQSQAMDSNALHFHCAFVLTRPPPCCDPVRPSAGSQCGAPQSRSATLQLTIRSSRFRMSWFPVLPLPPSTLNPLILEMGAKAP